MPKKLPAPETPAPKIRRDSAGKIVEYERVPVKYEPAPAPQPAVATKPTTLAQVASEFAIRRGLVEDSYRELFRRENIELSRQVGPAIEERDKAVIVARNAFDKRIRDLKQEEEREVARVTKAVRQSYLVTRRREEEGYERVKAAAYEAANDVIRQVEVKLQTRSQEIRAKKDEDLAALAKLEVEAREHVKALEKKEAEEAAEAAP